jgi:hypothetical protein
MTTANENSPGKPEGVITSPPATCSADTYAWWVIVIMVLMACLLVCVVAGQGSSAIAFAIVIHAASKIQQAEADRRNPPNERAMP